MKRDEEKKNDAGNSLNQIEPVSWVRVGQIIRPRLDRNYQTVDGVIDERYKDATDFHEDNVGNWLQVLDRIIEIGCAAERLGVRVEMFQQKKAERYNTW